MKHKALLIDPYTRTISDTAWSGQDVCEAADLLGVEYIETVAFDENHLLAFDEEGMLKHQVVRGGETLAQAYFVAMVEGSLLLLAGPAVVVGVGPRQQSADCVVSDQQLHGRISFVVNTLAASRLAQDLVIPIMVEDTPEGRRALKSQLAERQRHIRELIARDAA